MSEDHGPTHEELDEAYAIDAMITEDRSEEEQARRVDAVAMQVAAENHEAPSEAEVEALYCGTPPPEWRDAFAGLDTRGYDLAALDEVDDQAEDEPEDEPADG